ncbi:MAG: type II CAAX endopeptidase family protein [Methylococcaceae bacterium]
MIKNPFRLYQAILIFLGIAVWVVAASGAIEHFRWHLKFSSGLLIHSGIIIISLASIAVIIKSKNILTISRTINFKNTAWGYYLIAIVLAVIIWFADFWLQLFFFLDDGKKDGISLQTEINHFGILSIVIASCLLAPIAEEILFRGILLKGLLEKFNPFTAIIISALIFAAIHFSSEDFISLFVAAFGYALLTIKAQSILPAILAHMINNSVTIYYLMTL